MRGNNGPCIQLAGRATNDELREWLNTDATSDSSAFQRLFQAITPLLFAFFEGQTRGSRPDLQMLTLRTLMAIYQQRMSYDAHQPFRAWLLGIARLVMVDCLGCTQPHLAECTGVVGTTSGVGREQGEELLHSLAQRHAEDVCEYPILELAAVAIATRSVTA